MLKFSVLANHVIDHVIVGILLVVYSGVDHINTTCLSPQSCHSTHSTSHPLPHQPIPLVRNILSHWTTLPQPDEPTMTIDQPSDPLVSELRRNCQVHMSCIIGLIIGWIPGCRSFNISIWVGDSTTLKVREAHRILFRSFPFMVVIPRSVAKIRYPPCINTQKDPEEIRLDCPLCFHLFP